MSFSRDSIKDTVLVAEFELTLLDELLEEGLLFSSWLKGAGEPSRRLLDRVMLRVISRLTWIFGSFFICRPFGQWQLGWVCLFQPIFERPEAGEANFFAFQVSYANIVYDGIYDEKFEPRLALALGL